jgi:hypothetical protein
VLTRDPEIRRETEAIRIGERAFAHHTTSGPSTG